MKNIKKLLISLFVIPALMVGSGLIVGQAAYAQATPKDAACEGIKAAGGQCDTSQAQGNFQNIIRTVINILSIIVGAVSVIMIIIGGFRYVVSAGDSNAISGAKNTILYAVVGLAIVLFAQVIVAFVFTQATKSPTPQNQQTTTP